MANIKNLEMAAALSNNANIKIAKGFLGFGSKAIYIPTSSKLQATISYYNADEGKKIVNLVNSTADEIIEKAHNMKPLQKQSMSNYRVEVCASEDKEFIAVQVFTFSDLKYSALSKAKCFEGNVAKTIATLL